MDSDWEGYPGMNLGILISGRGSNMSAIINAQIRGELSATVSVVISDQVDAPGLKIAQQLGVPSLTVDPNSYESKAEFEQAVIDQLGIYQVDWIALAGYMRLVGPTLLAQYPNRIINIHPSLLPAFKGLNAQKQALEYGVKVSGCSIHYVNEEMDSGQIIDQVAVPVLSDDSETTLSARILVKEHELYPAVLDRLAKESIKK